MRRSGAALPCAGRLWLTPHSICIPFSRSAGRWKVFRKRRQIRRRSARLSFGASSASELRHEKKPATIVKSSVSGIIVTEQAAFEEILGLIERSRMQAAQAVNTTLIDLYWTVGEYIAHKIQSSDWGKGTVLSLSGYV